jgi:hypothetical protein
MEAATRRVLALLNAAYEVEEEAGTSYSCPAKLVIATITTMSVDQILTLETVLQCQE